MDADSSAAKAAAKRDRPPDSTRLYHQHLATANRLAEAADNSAVDEMSDDLLAGRDLESATPLSRTEHNIPSTSIPRHHKDLRQDSFFSTTSARSMVPVDTVRTAVEEDLPEPSTPRFVKATPTSHLPWSPPQGIPNLPPVSNFALTSRTPPQRPANKSKGASWICSVCRVRARSIDLERTIQCCNRNCGKWFHLRCVGLKDLPQGRYGWSCKECDPDDSNNGFFSINDNVGWQGDDEDGL